MWSQVVFIQECFQRIRPLRIQYSRGRGFYENVSLPEKITSVVLDLNLGLCFFMSLVGFKRFLTERPDTKDEGDQDAVKRFVLMGVLQLLFVGGNLAILPALWTVRYRYSGTIWMLNQALTFSRIRAEATASRGSINKQRDKSSLLFSMVTWSTVIAVAIGCLTLTLTPLIYNATPAHILISIFWKTSEGCLGNTIVSIIYLGVVYLIGGYPVCAPALVYTCAGHYETPFLLTKVKEYGKGRYSFQNEIMKYHNAYIFIRAFNQFGFGFWPILMAAGFCLNVATSFVCIKYRSSLSSMLVGMFVVFDVSVIIVTVGLHTFSVISLEASERFMKYWKLRVWKRLERMQFKSLSRIMVKIGAFFDLERKVILHTFDQIVDQTVALLILDS